MKKEKVPPVVNAGSLADVAFLLLIFFLVATTIQTDAGIPTVLPPWNEEAKPVPKNNLLSIEINGHGDVLVNQQLLPLAALKQEVRTLVLERAATPKKAVIELTSSTQTKYEDYVKVQDAIRAAYQQFWEDQAQQSHGVAFDLLSLQEQQQIKQQYPIVLAERQHVVAE